jgi:hypothetical protein
LSLFKRLKPLFIRLTTEAKKDKHFTRNPLFNASFFALLFEWKEALSFSSLTFFLLLLFTRDILIEKVLMEILLKDFVGSLFLSGV